ncbi:hypothetical protein MEO93_25630, partial [Dolichospermum sp. ST_sed3]|nr:hypothetical protein [Dolichospermum sp. ST_sed3]
RLTIPERGDASRLRRETRLQRWLMNARELSCVARIVFEVKICTVRLAFLVQTINNCSRLTN